MGRYSTTTSIYRMLPGLNDSPSSDLLIRQHADRVGGIIDSYVGRWYAVSGWTAASATPQQIQAYSDAITAELTMRSVYTQDGQNQNAWVTALSDRAWADLKLIQEQKLLVMDSDGTEADLSARGAFVSGSHSAYTPVFDMDAPESWAVDADLTRDIGADRD